MWTILRIWYEWFDLYTTSWQRGAPPRTNTNLSKTLDNVGVLYLDFAAFPYNKLKQIHHIQQPGPGGRIGLFDSR